MLLAGAVAPALAIPFPEPAARPHWECVPFARAISGVGIYGDAWTWWDQADGRYKRGSRPRVGAVMAFIPHNGMRLGHVAVVSEIIDARTIAVTHANWSPINGTRGQIERDVEVRDVSEAGDWSAVRVWFAPLDGVAGAWLHLSRRRASDRSRSAAPPIRCAFDARPRSVSRIAPRDAYRLSRQAASRIGARTELERPQSDACGFLQGQQHNRLVKFMRICWEL